MVSYILFGFVSTQIYICEQTKFLQIFLRYKRSPLNLGILKTYLQILFPHKYKSERLQTQQVEIMSDSLETLVNYIQIFQDWK